MELPERIIEVLETHDISLCGEVSERTYNNDGYDVELETYSPEGEDVIISFIYDGTEEDFIRQFERCAEDFLFKSYFLFSNIHCYNMLFSHVYFPLQTVE